MIRCVALNKESALMDTVAVLECTLATEFTAEVRNKKDCGIGGTRRVNEDKPTVFLVCYKMFLVR